MFCIHAAQPEVSAQTAAHTVASTRVYEVSVTVSTQTEPIAYPLHESSVTVGATAAVKLFCNQITADCVISFQTAAHTTLSTITYALSAATSTQVSPKTNHSLESLVTEGGTTPVVTPEVEPPIIGNIAIKLI